MPTTTASSSSSTLSPSSLLLSSCRPKDAPLSERWAEPVIKEVISLWNLSQTEQEGLRQLQLQLADVEHWKNRPEEVVRFLRARPGSVQDALIMFRNMIQWRVENKVDTILETYQPPAVLLSFYPGAVLEGVDKEGDPIFLGRLGVTDGIGLLERFGHDEMIRHAIWIRELVSSGEWLSHYEGNYGPVKRITIIEDLGGLSRNILSRQLLKTYSEIMRLDQDNYCETAKRLIVIRAPTIFRWVWSIAKHFFDPGVVDKMVFSGSSDYLEILDQYVDRDTLPPCLWEKGSGKVAVGMPDNLEGGRLPPVGEKN